MDTFYDVGYADGYYDGITGMALGVYSSGEYGRGYHDGYSEAIGVAA